MHSFGARALGLVLGLAADSLLGDPRRWHPVAGFGTGAQVLERWLYRDSRTAGVLHTAASTTVPVALGLAAERVGRGRPATATALTALATWTVLGGTSLAREGSRMAELLETGDLDEARRRLPHLCARDPSHLDQEELARATVESLAENTSDAVVAPLCWGAVAGIPGLLGYRAVNTLDAMVGYRSARYRRFGWAAARLDDALNLVPARLTGLLTVACAAAVGGSPVRAWRVLRRDGGRHPSPNAGRPEAAAAGALGVRLGGSNRYHGQMETRPELGDGPPPAVPDVRRAVRLGRLVAVGAIAVTAGVALAAGRARAASERHTDGR